MSRARFALKSREMFRTIALTSIAAFVAATTISLAPPAHAQIGNIFSEPTPRPPGNIPRGGNQPPPDDEEEVPELPQGRLLPTPNRPPPGQGIPAPGNIQSQPLAPPPGTTVIPQNAPPGIAVAPPQPGQGVAVAPPGAAAGAEAAQGRAAIAGHIAARRRSGFRAAGAEDRQQEGKLFRARQDHRAHHQLR